MQTQCDLVQEKLKALSSSALELMILHCTILFPLITWACIFVLFSSALGMLLPLWDSNEYPLGNVFECSGGCGVSLSCQPSIFPCSISFCESTRREEEIQTQSVNGRNWPLLHQMELFRKPLWQWAINVEGGQCVFSLLLKIDNLTSKWRVHGGGETVKGSVTCSLWIRSISSQV